MIGLAAIGIVGYILIKKVSDLGAQAGQTVTDFVTGAENKYKETVSDIKQTASDTATHAKDAAKTAATTAAYTNPVTAPLAWGITAVDWLKDTFFDDDNGSGDSSGGAKTNNKGSATTTPVKVSLAQAAARTISNGKIVEGTTSNTKKYVTAINKTLSSKTKTQQGIKRSGGRGTGESKVKIIRKNKV